MSRIEPLKALIAQDPGNSRYRFMLAMEYKNAGESEGAVAALDELIGVDGNYVSAYFQAGQISEQAGSLDRARSYYSAGVECAKRIGDTHALGEIQGALDLLG